MKKMILALLFLMALPLSASAVVFTFSDGGTHSASADFAIVSGNLQVTITNTYSGDALNVPDLLTAVFFKIAGDPLLTRISVVVPSGSSLIGTLPSPAFDPSPNGVGGEFSYLNNLTPWTGMSDYSGISNAGFTIFGPGNRFPGNNLQGPTSPDGGQYAITSAGDNAATGSGVDFTSSALIKNSVIATLGGLPGGFSLNDISGVIFNWGTSLNEPPPPPPSVPEPGTMLLLGSGLVGLAGWGRKKYRK